MGADPTNCLALQLPIHLAWLQLLQLSLLPTWSLLVRTCSHWLATSTWLVCVSYQPQLSWASQPSLLSHLCQLLAQPLILPPEDGTALSNQWCLLTRLNYPPKYKSKLSLLLLYRIPWRCIESLKTCFAGLSPAPVNFRSALTIVPSDLLTQELNMQGSLCARQQCYRRSSSEQDEIWRVLAQWLCEGVRASWVSLLLEGLLPAPCCCLHSPWAWLWLSWTSELELQLDYWPLQLPEAPALTTHNDMNEDSLQQNHACLGRKPELISIEAQSPSILNSFLASRHKPQLAKVYHRHDCMLCSSFAGRILSRR